jgi:hypothetical protein
VGVIKVNETPYWYDPESFCQIWDQAEKEPEQNDRVRLSLKRMEKWDGVREISDILERTLESFNLSSFGHMERTGPINGIPDSHAAVMFVAPTYRVKCLICSLMHALSDADRSLSQQPQPSCSAARVRPRHKFGNGTIFLIGYLASRPQFGKETGIRSCVIAAQGSFDIQRCKSITKNTILSHQHPIRYHRRCCGTLCSLFTSGSPTPRSIQDKRFTQLQTPSSSFSSLSLPNPWACLWWSRNLSRR